MYKGEEVKRQLTRQERRGFHIRAFLGVSRKLAEKCIPISSPFFGCEQNLNIPDCFHSGGQTGMYYVQFVFLVELLFPDLEF